MIVALSLLVIAAYVAVHALSDRLAERRDAEAQLQAMREADR